MASALFSRSGTALLGFAGTIVVLGVLVPFLLLWLVPTTWVLVYFASDQGLLAAGHTYGCTMALALLLGAWGAAGRAPGDRLRLCRPWKAAVAVAVFGVLATATVMLQPLRVDSSQPQAVRWLGDGTTLECARAPGVIPRRCHPVVHGRDGVEKTFRRSFSTPEQMYAHPGRGVAVIDQLSMGSPLLGRSPGRWLIVDRRGDERYLARPDDGQPIGWSHRGSYFAWRMLSRQTKPGHPDVVSGLMLLDEDFEIRRQPVETPSADWTAVWIDDRRLLLTPQYYGAQPRQQGWWMVISADGEKVEVGPQPLPEGTFLFPPALVSSPAPLTVRGNELVLLLSNGRHDMQLAKLDLGSGELHPGAAVSLQGSGSLDSFGTLADGRAVWAEYAVATTAQADRGTSRIMTSPAKEPEEICRHFGLDQVFGSYRGTTGSWALWNGKPGFRLYACHLGTGEVRILRNLGPLGPRSADLGEGAVMTAGGKILLD
ncbi:MAG: hypothetical protein GY856_10000 [bacterium]|nr:hypothetical protein [bacterium]